jgi:hypothetical protein
MQSFDSKTEVMPGAGTSQRLLTEIDSIRVQIQKFVHGTSITSVPAEVFQLLSSIVSSAAQRRSSFAVTFGQRIYSIVPTSGIQGAQDFKALLRIVGAHQMATALNHFGGQDNVDCARLLNFIPQRFYLNKQRRMLASVPPSVLGLPSAEFVELTITEALSNYGLGVLDGVVEKTHYDF